MRFTDVHYGWWVAAAVLTVIIAVACMVSGCGTALHDIPGWESSAVRLEGRIASAERRLEELRLLRDEESEALKADPDRDNEPYLEMAAKIAQLSGLVEAGKADLIALNARIAEAKAAGERAEGGILEAIGDAPVPYSGLLVTLAALGFQLVRSRGQNAAAGGLVKSLQPIVDALGDTERTLLRSRQTKAVKALVDKHQDEAKRQTL